MMNNLIHKVLLSALFLSCVPAFGMDIFQAAMTGNLERVQELIAAQQTPGQKRDFVNKQDNTPYGNTPLHLAAGAGYIATVQALIAAGADVNKANNNKQTPLHEAAYYGHIAVVRALIEAGADVNRENKYGKKPWHMAIRPGQKETEAIVRELLYAGAKVGSNKACKDLLAVNPGDSAEVSVGLLCKASSARHLVGFALACALHDRLGADSPAAMLSQDLMARIACLTLPEIPVKPELPPVAQGQQAVKHRHHKCIIC